MSKQGQNVWHELMTTDVETAKRFYTETIGWKAQKWEDSDPNNPYTVWMSGERPIGGLMALPEEAKKMGAPSSWMAYTAVDDVDATSEKAESLGGKIQKPGFDIPKVGRIAILSDPQGAVFAVYKPAEPMPQTPKTEVGDFSWAELNTTDYEGAWKFYSELFGWQHSSSMDMGEAGTYFMFQDRDEITKGGMSNTAKRLNVPPHWLHYVTVADMDGAVERIKQCGGSIVNGPMSIPGDDLVAQCKDPTGVIFAIYAAKKKS